jgi:4'-phosphopantetheinyl transferase
MANAAIASLPEPSFHSPIDRRTLSPFSTVALFQNDAVEVVHAMLDESPGAARELASLLSPSERDRAIRFASDLHRRRYIVARARLRQLLAARLAATPVAIEFAYGERGKPTLGQRFADSGLRFNVSHSEDVAVYAFAIGREVGVDVEAICALKDADAIAARFFSHREKEAYLALDPSDRPLGFFNCWTRKEAFIKAIGDGLTHPLDRFDVSLSPGERAELLSVGDTPGNACGWKLYSFPAFTGFVGAVVVQERSIASWNSWAIDAPAPEPMTGQRFRT